MISPVEKNVEYPGNKNKECLSHNVENKGFGETETNEWSWEWANIRICGKRIIEIDVFETVEALESARFCLDYHKARKEDELGHLESLKPDDPMEGSWT